MTSDNNFQEVKLFIKHILKKRGIVGIKKTTRVGVTTNTIIESIAKGKKILVIMPTNKLCDEKCDLILNKFPNKNCYVLGANYKICKKVQEEISINENLRNFPFHSRDCKGCEYDCLFREIIFSDLDVLFMTSQKLSMIPFRVDENSTKETQKLVELIRNHFDIVLVDEIMYQLTNLTDSISTKKLGIVKNQLLSIKELTNTDSKFLDYVNKTLSYYNKIKDSTIYFKPIKGFNIDIDIKKYQNLLKDRFVQGENTLSIVELFNICYNKTNIFLLKNYKKEVFIVSIPNIDVLNRLSIFFKDKLIILTDAGFPHIMERNQNIEIDFGTFMNLPYESVTIPNEGDPLNTNNWLLVVADKKKVTQKTYNHDKKKHKEKAIEFVRKIRDLFSEKCVILAPNKIIHRELKTNWYYRDDKSRGVDISEGVKRLGFLLAPTLPERSLLPLAYLFKGHIKQNGRILSKINTIEFKLRCMEEVSTFINSATRQKSPNGKYFSITFLYGIRKEDVNNLFSTIGVRTPHIIEIYKQDTLIQTAYYIDKLWVDFGKTILDKEGVEDIAILSYVCWKINSLKYSNKDFSFKNLIENSVTYKNKDEVNRIKQILSDYRYIISRLVGEVELKVLLSTMK
jgi:hypothetical protein